MRRCSPGLVGHPLLSTPTTVSACQMWSQQNPPEAVGKIIHTRSKPVRDRRPRAASPACRPCESFPADSPTESHSSYPSSWQKPYRAIAFGSVQVHCTYRHYHVYAIQGRFLPVSEPSPRRQGALHLRSDSNAIFLRSHVVLLAFSAKSVYNASQADSSSHATYQCTSCRAWINHQSPRPLVALS